MSHRRRLPPGRHSASTAASSSAVPACSRVRSRSTPSLLAACGGDDDDDSGGGGGGGGGKSIAISNWPATWPTSRSQDFEAATGISVNYDEDINDNNEYFAKIRPNLSQGEGIGRDGMVLTDWMASRLINQVDPPWVQPFDAAAFPNKSNLIPALAVAGFDPTREYSAPWAIGRDRDRVQHRDDRASEIRTIDDFLDGPGHQDGARPRCATRSGCSCSPAAPIRRVRR